MFIWYGINCKSCLCMVYKYGASENLVEGLKDIGMNQKRMYLIMIFRGILNFKENRLSSDMMF